MIPDKPITKDSPFRILFVCLGNICRSPTAEGVFQHLVNEEGLQGYFEIESAGTSAYHIGEPANSKSQQTANRHGITLHSRARRFESSDLDYYNLVLAMDKENLSNIKSLDAQSRYGHKIALMREFDPNPGDREVPDPYYGGIDGFEKVFQVVRRSCQELLDRLSERVDADSGTES
ncbi:MAG: low molecular weight protein-tyrosine-phosphatase [Balneolaceae bacterium]|nr:low molecular weight protein-tyrosine-phosphatase [Balneolaceae bacterium]